MVIGKTRVLPMTFDTKKTIFNKCYFKEEFFERDFFFCADGNKVYLNHHCKITFNLSFPFIKNFRNSVDVGCRDGEYTRFLQKYFNHTYCFDSRLSNFFPYNVNINKVSHFQCALGDENKVITMSGGTHKKIPGYMYQTKCHRLDDLQLNNIDYLKVDVEGFEKKVIKGSINTIKKNSPVIVIEQNDEVLENEKKYEAKNFLEKNLDYKCVAICPRGWDYIMIKN